MNNHDEFVCRAEINGCVLPNVLIKDGRILIRKEPIGPSYTSIVFDLKPDEWFDLFQTNRLLGQQVEDLKYKCNRAEPSKMLEEVIESAESSAREAEALSATNGILGKIMVGQRQAYRDVIGMIKERLAK